MAIDSAANLLQSEAKAIYVDVPRHQNMAVIKSLRDSATEKIVQFTGIYMGGQTRRVRIYATAPKHSCRGIVLVIEAGTSPEELMQDLCAPNWDVLSARIMRRSETALLTFRSTYVPRFILNHRDKYDCKPHNPKAQFCFTCYGIGHRADICAQAGVVKCKACDSLLDTPDQEHSGNIQRTIPHVQTANKLTPRHPRRRISRESRLERNTRKSPKHPDKLLLRNSEEESPRRTSLTQKRELDTPYSKRQSAVLINNQELDFSELKTPISGITAKLEAATKAAEGLEKKTHPLFMEIEQKAEQSACQLALMMEKIDQWLKAVQPSLQDIQRRLSGLESTPSSAHRFASPRSHPYASEAKQRQRNLITNNGDT
ncbi:hypothetical protein HPB48_015655 [Haemaphysalis longicornis]|uniref:Uncharacterized protein n=1 Tax=Haemaphysalis longicornis TaxID=44386 RepID=A0A9J6GX37_HAELO|nr:hypothetical protein HPB48_015655 [Haemaphysalis longicornis]